jgi:hypothetical protein
MPGKKGRSGRRKGSRKRMRSLVELAGHIVNAKIESFLATSPTRISHVDLSTKRKFIGEAIESVALGMKIRKAINDAILKARSEGLRSPISHAKVLDWIRRNPPRDSLRRRDKQPRTRLEHEVRGECSRCGFHIIEIPDYPYRFCGRCGAFGEQLTGRTN